MPKILNVLQTFSQSFSRICQRNDSAVFQYWSNAGHRFAVFPTLVWQDFTVLPSFKIRQRSYSNARFNLPQPRVKTISSLKDLWSELIRLWIAYIGVIIGRFCQKIKQIYRLWKNYELLDWVWRTVKMHHILKD